MMNTTELAKRYLLSGLKEDTLYDGYYINDEYNIIKTKVKIMQNGIRDYHNNIDKSESDLYVGQFNNNYIKQWWTLDETEALNMQDEIIMKKISAYTIQIKELKNKIGFIKENPFNSTL